MKFKLTEHFINLVNDEDRKKQYVNEVVDLINKAYANIGGANLNVAEIMEDNIMWKLCYRGDHISALTLYKVYDGNNRKAFIGCTDGTPQGKADLYMIMREDAKRDVFVEVSHAMEHMYIKSGMQYIDNKMAEAILKQLNKKVISLDDDGIHYTRNIGNVPRVKAMVGKIPSWWVGFE